MTQSISGKREESSLTFNARVFPFLGMGIATRIIKQRPGVVTGVGLFLSLVSAFAFSRITDLFSRNTSKQLRNFSFQKTSPQKVDVKTETKPAAVEPVKETLQQVDSPTKPIHSADSPTQSIARPASRVRKWEAQRAELLKSSK
ncbi:MAG TPA: hypothetical protein VMR37_00680 [Rhabdochlamydiaceae bacterium]|nr:hypothetical protein [Rhabdochlamydiaceae bacterium]